LNDGLNIWFREAPVDGQNGKPRQGPWVKTPTEGQGTGEAKPTPSSLDRYLKEAAKEGWDTVPETNDGVMDDPNRVVPKKGTTGTEGGVSEKVRDRKAQQGQTGSKSGNVPQAPKEAPPLPQSEVDKAKAEQDGGSEETATPLKGVKGLEVRRACYLPQLESP
jgi:Ca2+/H+ antiporter, TMEM165/GDT1 family